MIHTQTGLPPDTPPPSPTSIEWYAAYLEVMGDIVSVCNVTDAGEGNRGRELGSEGWQAGVDFTLHQRLLGPHTRCHVAVMS